MQNGQAAYREGGWNIARHQLMGWRRVLCPLKVLLGSASGHAGSAQGPHVATPTTGEGWISGALGFMRQHGPWRYKEHH